MSDNFDSQIEVQRRELNAVLGGEDDIELLGRAMVYRAGEVIVPRDWLVSRCRDLDIPEMLLPSKPTPHSAYKRAMDRLVTSNVQDWPNRTDKRYYNFPGVADEHNPLEVSVDLKDGEGNVKHLSADVFMPEEMIGREGGKWTHHELGHFNYLVDGQKLTSSKADDVPGPLNALWAELADRAEKLFYKMQESHTGQDLRNMVYLNMVYNSPADWPSVIPLIDKGGLYFVPEGPMSDVIDDMATVFHEANDFKVGGSYMAIRTLEVVDSDDKREWVRQRVEESLEKVVDDAIEAAMDAFSDGEDVDEIVDSVVEHIDAEGHSAEQYNNLLQAKLDVEAMLANRAKETDDADKEQIIQSALSQLDL